MTEEQWKELSLMWRQHVATADHTLVYTTTVKQISQLIERRRQVGATYISANTIIVAVIAYLLKDGGVPGAEQGYALVVLLFAGLITCVQWSLLSWEHSKLLEWWYGKLRQLEENLDGGMRLFTSEYEEIYSVPLADEGESANSNAKTGRFVMSRYLQFLPGCIGLVYLIFLLCLLFSLCGPAKAGEKSQVSCKSTKLLTNT